MKREREGKESDRRREWEKAREREREWTKRQTENKREEDITRRWRQIDALHNYLDEKKSKQIRCRRWHRRRRERWSRGCCQLIDRQPRLTLPLSFSFSLCSPWPRAALSPGSHLLIGRTARRPAKRISRFSWLGKINKSYPCYSPNRVSRHDLIAVPHVGSLVRSLSLFSFALFSWKMASSVRVNIFLCRRCDQKDDVPRRIIRWPASDPDSPFSLPFYLPQSVAYSRRSCSPRDLNSFLIIVIIIIISLPSER